MSASLFGEAGEPDHQSNMANIDLPEFPGLQSRDLCPFYKAFCDQTGQMFK